MKDTYANGPFNEDMGPMEQLRLKMLEKRAPMPQQLKRDLAKVMARCDQLEKERKNRLAAEC